MPFITDTEPWLSDSPLGAYVPQQSLVVGPAPPTDLFSRVGADAQFVATGTTITFTIPVGAVNGDVVCFHVAEQGASLPTYSANRGIGVPTCTAGQSADNVAGWAYIINATDPGQVVTITSSRSGPKVVVMRCLHPLTGPAQIDVTPVVNLSSVNSLTPTTAAVTTTQNKDAIIATFSIATAAARTWGAAPTGLTLVNTVDTGATAGGAAAACYDSVDIGAAGAFAAWVATVTSGGTNPNAGIAFSLQIGAGPPPASIIYGTSFPGYPEVGGQSATVSIIRTFTTGQRDSAPNTEPQIHSSSDIMTSTFVNNYIAQQAAALSTMQTRFSAVPDVAGCYGCPYHEWDNSGVTTTQIQQILSVFMTVTLPAVNAGRVNKMKGINISTGTWYGTSSQATMDAALAGTNIDLTGADVYANLGNLTAAATEADHLGVPLMLGELGTSVNTNPLDSDHLTHMNQFLSDNNALTHPATPVCWYDANHNLLDTTLHTALTGGESTVVVDALPGISGGTYSIAAGAQILVDPHGTFPETVTLTAGFSGAHQTTYSLGITATFAHPHAAGVPIYLMPTAIAKWRSLQGLP